MAKSYEQLLEYVISNADIGGDVDVLEKDCDNIVFLLDNCGISVPQANRFFVDVACKGLQDKVWNKRSLKYRAEIFQSKYANGRNALTYTGYYDFGHTSAEWESVIGLGIFGLRQRVAEYAERHSGDPHKTRFFANTLRVYDAALRFMKRTADICLENGRTEMGDSLLRLCSAAPSTLYEAMQTSIVYYNLQHHFECTSLRTLGRLDSLLYPFYIKEDAAFAKQLLADYIKEINLFCAVANIPFALGGSDADGKCLVNELSYEILKAYQSAGVTDTKLHLLCTPDMPEDIVRLAFDGVRDGYNSIVFMGDSRVRESLEKLGTDFEDAANYHVVGCYECGADNEVTCSCNARVSIPKALDYALNSGVDTLAKQKVGLDNSGDFATFREFYDEFIRQLQYLCDCAMEITDIYERRYTKLHAAPIFSGTLISALERGGDVYCDNSARYCNSSVNALGLATAVDSLAAIKKLCFEDRTLTLEQFKEILKNDWQDNEPLRMLIKNKFPKYGMGDAKTDCLAGDIVKRIAERVSGRPNAKGGVYRLGLFSIDWRWEFGEHTCATADGRRAGEPISQNSGASFGADRLGATAHLLSTTAIDTTDTPNGTVIDIDLHSSAVKGENGLVALVSTLKTFFEHGGFAVHYNILDTEVLKDARLHPEKYPNLQVRLCGWNVLFSSLSDKEKDEFIARSQK